MTFLDVMDADNASIHSGEFSEPITIDFSSELGPEKIDITGIFDRTYETIDPETGVPVMSSSPRVSIFLKDFEDKAGAKLAGYLNGNATLTVRGETYKISEVREDGSGCASLMLNE